MPVSRRAFLGGLSAALAAPAAGAPPNIVLCMSDDQGWGDVGYRNHPVLKTPVMDELAATGLRFERFYAAAPVCSPTRASVLTGRHPNRCGCFSWGYTIRPQEITVAEALKTAGYRTGHFGKWHVGPVRAESPIAPGASGFDEWFSSPNFFENNPLMSRKGNVVRTRGEGSEVVVDAAIEFIRGAVKARRPFLAVVWFGSPHVPYEALEEDRLPYRGQPEKLQHYYGEIAAMDRAIGKLRRELRTLGTAGNTLFWYNSDNGPIPIGSTGGLSGLKGDLGEGGIRVPAMVEWPDRIPSPRIIDIPCGTVDIYPTLIEIAGARVPRQVRPLDGISLIPLFEGRMERRTKPLGFWVYPERGVPVSSARVLEEMERGAPAPAAPDPGRITARYPLDHLPGPAAWIDGDYKLHRRRETLELYNLAADAAETNNLAAREPERAAQMGAALEAWQKSVVRSLNGADYRA